MSLIVTTGAVGGVNPSGGSPYRLEITDLIADEKLFSLYIQALSKVYSVNQDDPLSYFQIGGIHGQPAIPWNDSEGTRPDQGQVGYYCPHSTVIFPTWHRPYVALLEQRLQQLTKEIAENYTQDQVAWKTAAANFRAPYWDWVKNPTPPKEVIESKTVTITTPDGRKEVDNPLLGYTFHPQPDFQPWGTTVRHPNPDGTSNVTQLKAVLLARNQDIKDKTSFMLSQIHDWPNFSKNTRGGGNASSLEAIHDTMHNSIGGGGNMSSISIAAFDPIFYMHHANVDRLLSIWSGLNPGVWVTPDQFPNGTVDVNTELNPFNDSQTSYWASSGVADTNKFNYSYQEVSPAGTFESRDALARKVAEIYSAQTISQFPGRGGRGLPVGESVSNTITEWIVRIRFKKFELGGSGSILVFLGPLPDDIPKWYLSPHFVGAVDVFANPNPEQCPNCQNQINAEVQGFVHLNKHIAEKSGLRSFDIEAVKPYLERELKWQVVRADYTPVNASALPSLELAVLSAPLTLEVGGILPTLGEFRHHKII